MDHIVESDSESDHGKQESHLAKPMSGQNGAEPGTGGAVDMNDDEDASLTLEDKKDIEEMREEDRRSNLESIGRRTRNQARAASGVDPLLQAQQIGEESEDEEIDDLDEEEDEDDLDDLGDLDEISSEDDSYDLQEIDEE